MQYIIKNKDVYLVEVIWSKNEFNYTWSVGSTHYFETHPNESRLKVLKKMYSMKALKAIKDKINEYSQGKLF